ncbi:MAG: hypothetical protein AUF64_05655 [Chloroflexi bacterium 13_1_20CM_54_36]|nr:MAG: hypothetical protein AUH05_00670 [Ktedonobacter sp. 13_2_20CM_53_11]OLB55696.1 MAG: hypothetical protein AUI01_07535 [Ktedonobacter sp. 13_2_20CM_2_56_8]OLD82998.1 MAG: hypothetical protein AUF64_05655 [Chloroflexi bacterium 13_1_20CM_54_36]OLE09534.1 MAG: hypothetical protein AUG82_00135 [Ktedonobacter sp. 13_1_20CM_4_53_11]OLE35358.1 MAG: hypothetical protein AUG45_01970 [Ktedonobacter sp. 13_1_20CM_3_54_15]
MFISFFREGNSASAIGWLVNFFGLCSAEHKKRAIVGLDLSQVEPGTYELICLPVKIDGSDGAPARAILRKMEEDDNA